MRINFIFLVLFLILAITTFNLFFKPEVYESARGGFAELARVTGIGNPFDRLFCPFRGYKCVDDCECREPCGDRVVVEPGDDVAVYNEKLDPGTYCLPSGILKCPPQYTVPVYSLSGWTCVSKNPAVWRNNESIACKSKYARDDALNYLVDAKTGEKVEGVVRDYYEMYGAKMRYSCACNSVDQRGNRMISLPEVPFACVPDYCLSNLRDQVGLNLGWNGSRCDCMHYANEGGPATPCVNKKIGFGENDSFVGMVKTTDSMSTERRPIFHTEPTLFFEKRIANYALPIDYFQSVV